MKIRKAKFYSQSVKDAAAIVKALHDYEINVKAMKLKQQAAARADDKIAEKDKQAMIKEKLKI